MIAEWKLNFWQAFGSGCVGGAVTAGLLDKPIIAGLLASVGVFFLFGALIGAMVSISVRMRS